MRRKDRCNTVCKLFIIFLFLNVIIDTVVYVFIKGFNISNNFIVGLVKDCQWIYGYIHIVVPVFFIAFRYFISCIIVNSGSNSGKSLVYFNRLVGIQIIMCDQLVCEIGKAVLIQCKCIGFISFILFHIIGVITFIINIEKIFYIRLVCGNFFLTTAGKSKKTDQDHKCSGQAFSCVFHSNKNSS